MPTITKNLLGQSSDIGANPTHKIVISAADLAALGASTAGTLTIDAGIAVGDVLHDFYLYTPTAVVATSMTALTVKTGVSGTLEAFGTAATSDAVAGIAKARGVGTSNGGYVPASTTYNKVVVTFAATGANLSAITAGEIDIYFTCNPGSSFFY